MQKLSSFFIAIILVGITLTSCKKDPPVLPESSADGATANKSDCCDCCPTEPPTVTGGAMNFSPTSPSETMVHIELNYTNPSNAGSFRTVITIPNRPNLVIVTPVGYSDITNPESFPLDFMVPVNANNPAGTFDVKVIGRSADINCPRSRYEFSYSVNVN